VVELLLDFEKPDELMNLEPMNNFSGQRKIIYFWYPTVV
jgi:hypothetical protein